MKAGHPGYLWSKYECFLIYELLKNLHIKLGRSVMGMRTWTRTTRVTKIALLVLRIEELMTIWEPRPGCVITKTVIMGSGIKGLKCK